jgi:hypothetical protein
MLRLPAFLSRVAAEYDTLSHTPENPAVRAPYDALCDALAVQYAQLSALVQIRFTAVDPYPSSVAMFDDLAHGRLSVYTVADLPSDHPFTRRNVNGQTYNSIFRAVHDGLAHFPGLHPFSYRGEFAAFKAHARMLAGNVPAIHALATETLGQNAWYNFSKRNTAFVRFGSPKVFAPQYAALLPWGTVREALTEVN